MKNTMADNKISIDIDGFLEKARMIQSVSTAFQDAPEVKYRLQKLPFVQAHMQMLAEIEALLADYTELINKDFKRCLNIADTFKAVDDAQTGIS